MVSIIRQHINIPENSILPRELADIVLDKADLCSKIVTLTDNGILILDYKTRRLIRNIKYMYYFRLSVSRCGNYAVASNEHYPVHVWNINTGLRETIEDFPFSSDNIPYHTFSLNNELLVTYKNYVYSFQLSDKLHWILNYRYEIMDSSSNIFCIQSNTKDHTFACVNLEERIYIFNSITKNIDHVIDIRQRNSPNIMDLWFFIDFNSHFIGIIKGPKTVVYNLKTNSTVVLQKPKSASRSIMDRIEIKKMHILPCLTKAICGCAYGVTFLFDIKTGQIIKKLDSFMNVFSTLTPCNTQIVTSDRDKHMRIINLQDLI